MIKTKSGARKIEGTDNWREIFDDHNYTVDALDQLADDMAIIVNGNKTAYASGAAVGQYVLLRNSTITDRADGMYKAAKAIPYNTTIDKTYLTAVSGGAINSLSDQIGTLNSKISKNTLDNVVDISSYNSSNNQYTIPDDGYIQLNASYATPGVEISCRINNYLSITIQSISASSTANVVFVRKGMTVYKSTTNGTLYYYKLI